MRQLPAESLYKSVKTAICQKIINQEWKPGDCLPSEHNIGRLFNASQGTVRKALTELEYEHVVIRHQGKGTFVSSHKNDRSLFRFFQFYDKNNNWQRPQSKLLSHKKAKGKVIHYQRLRLKPGEQIYVIHRVRQFAALPVIVEDISLPTKLFPGLPCDALPNALYQYYEQHYNIIVGKTEERMQAIAASQREADVLRIAVGTPLLQIERTAFGLNRVPVELRVSYCLTQDYYYACGLNS